MKMKCTMASWDLWKASEASDVVRVSGKGSQIYEEESFCLCARKMVFPRQASRPTGWRGVAADPTGTEQQQRGGSAAKRK